MARDIKKLHPDLQVVVKKFQAKCLKQGLKVGIGECVRTVTEQNTLYAKGRTTPGTIATNARGSSYGSMHQWGVAFDFYRNDGKGAYNDSDNFFYKVGQIGKEYGLFWGGDFKSIIDKPHFQVKKYSPDGTTYYLKKKYLTPSAFMQTWGKEPVKAATSTMKIYTVKKGDILSDIAKKYDTTVDKLVELNGIKDANSINIGQALKLG